MAFLGSDLEFVEITLAESRHEDFPDTATASQSHGVAATVPVVEVSDQAYAPRIRSPDGEQNTLNAFQGELLRTHPIEVSVVAPLSDEVNVQVAEAGRKAVRILKGPRVFRSLVGS